MLKEISHSSGANRRWFNDDYFDLIVWYDGARTIIGFPLSCDRNGYVRTLTWRAGQGLEHHRIDSGEPSPFKNRSPTSVRDGVVPYDALVRQFTPRTEKFDAAIYDLVLKKLSEGDSESAGRF